MDDRAHFGTIIFVPRNPHNFLRACMKALGITVKMIGVETENRSTYDTDLTDTAWELMAPVLPQARPGGRPRTTGLRSVVKSRELMHLSGWKHCEAQSRVFKITGLTWIAERSFGRNRRLSEDYEYRVRLPR